MLLLMKAATLKSVDKHWEDIALTSGEKLPEATQTAQPQPKKSGKPRRRDDLTGIGPPIPPTATKYPFSRATCGHVDPETAAAAASP